VVIDRRERLGVMLPASMIPDGAIVTKRTGSTELVLRHSLRVYPIQGSGQVPMVVEGTFLHAGRGDINQIKPDTILVWRIEAEDFVIGLQSTWEDAVVHQ